MSTEHLQDGTAPGGFVVRPDGSVVGDDGAGGALAAALPYTGRLARRTGELLGAGDLRTMEAIGLRRLRVVVTWTPAGEGTYRASVDAPAERVVPTYMVVGGVDTPTAVAHCLDRIMGLQGVRWSSVVTAGSRVIAAQGDRQELHHLAEVGTRMLAVLRSLADQHATGFLRLRFEGGAVIGASLGRHALVAYADTAGDDELVARIDEVRAILAEHDLTSVTSEFDPDAPDAAEEDGTSLPEAAVAPPLVGARFGGAVPREQRRARRPLFGR